MLLVAFGVTLACSKVKRDELRRDGSHACLRVNLFVKEVHVQPSLICYVENTLFFSSSLFPIFVVIA